MWHRFEASLRRAILGAFQNAGRDTLETGDSGRAVTTWDFLVRIEAESALVSQMLARQGVSPEALRAAWERADSSEAPATGTVLTPAARAAFEDAYQVAAELGDSSIAGEHLLLALVRKPECHNAGRDLAHLGVDWQGTGLALMAVQSWRLCPPPGIQAPGLRSRRLKHWLRRQAGRVRRLGYAALHWRSPFLPYVIARKRIEQDPYPFYARLRRRSVVWEPLLGQWVVTGYADVSAALAEPRLSQRLFGVSAWEHNDLPPCVQREFRCLQGGLDRQMLFLDAPEQPRQRSLVAKRFTPRVIARMQDQMQEIAEELLDAAASAGRMEVINDLAVPLPLRVIVRMLGLPQSELPRFKRWSADFFTFLTFDTNLVQDLAAYQSVREATDYFRALLPPRRQNPQDDLLTLLLQPDEQGEYLDDEEVVANCLMLLATGHENTTRLIGNGLFALLTRPDQWRMLRDDPDLIGPTVEEMLRYDSPVQWTLRHMAEDLQWRGHALKRGQWVHVGLAAANRDPAQFSDADRFDITRSPNRHVAFGHGPHFCLGAALGRLEAHVALTALAARFPNLCVDPDRPPVRALDGLAFRGLHTLHIRWVPVTPTAGPTSDETLCSLR